MTNSNFKTAESWYRYLQWKGAQNMKLICIFLCALIFFSTIHAQNRDSIFVQIYPDSVSIWNTDISAACGTSYTTSASIAGDSIAILESDTSKSYQRCMCNYDVNVKLAGLAVGNYRVFICRTGTFNKDTSYVGSVDFTVQQPGSPQFSCNSYSSACHGMTGVLFEGTGVPRNSFLIGNYPNPFNPLTVIQYQINKRNKVKLEIFDELGRFTAVLVDEEKDVGDYEIPWNASSYSSGLYLCKLSVGNEIQTLKMTLLK
jgi:hypothetical protein